jgi:anhydro-N-acetylmuramic acid kinase
MLSPNIKKLQEIAEKSERKIIGLMSGTSLDGLDIALCSVRNSGPSTTINVMHFATIPYSEDERLKIREVFAKTQVNLESLCNLNAWIGILHSNLIIHCLRAWGVPSSDVDLVASHGQTIFHSPKSNSEDNASSNSTFQIGDGDHIAMITGIVTISDFRQKHVAAGGEGAPLALYGDYFIFSKQNENRIMLNIGGIANFTCLYGDLDARRAFATDVGPGNTMIDAFVRKHFGLNYDSDGRIAEQGKINDALLIALKAHKFFSLTFPKTTGPELFNMTYLETAQASIKDNSFIPLSDVVATLTRFTAEVIAESIWRVDEWKQFKIYCSGGGIHNPILMDNLKQLLPEMEIRPTDVLGISGDAKEAVLFATLANETMCGGETDFGDRINIPTVSMGKISFPK